MYETYIKPINTKIIHKLSGLVMCEMTSTFTLDTGDKGKRFQREYFMTCGSEDIKMGQLNIDLKTKLISFSLT